MKETKFFCDLCKNETPKKELASLTLEVSRMVGYSHSHLAYTHEHVCFSCLLKRGFFKAQEDQPPKPVPTMAEQLVQLFEEIAAGVAEEIVQNANT